MIQKIKYESYLKKLPVSPTAYKTSSNDKYQLGFTTQTEGNLPLVTQTCLRANWIELGPKIKKKQNYNSSPMGFSQSQDPSTINNSIYIAT